MLTSPAAAPAAAPEPGLAPPPSAAAQAFDLQHAGIFDLARPGEPPTTLFISLPQVEPPLAPATSDAARPPAPPAPPAPPKPRAPPKPPKPPKPVLSADQLNAAVAEATTRFFVRPQAEIMPGAKQAAADALAEATAGGLGVAPATELVDAAVTHFYHSEAMRRGITPEQARQLFPGLRDAPTPDDPATAENETLQTPSLQEDLPAINDAMLAYGIDDSALAQRGFLTQAAVESDQMNTKHEYGSDWSKYDNRAALCNGEGDGNRYPGLGIFQITGRCNVEHMTEVLGPVFGADYLADPSLLMRPRDSAYAAAEFFVGVDGIALSNASNVDELSQMINGGSQGRAERWAQWDESGAIIPQDPPK
ncbi:MAG: hypothetical protein IPJ65_28175 [Archangiaceae bacterium]|nr:hypothetical protein [Archangiaceae bacterium]